MSGGHDGGQQGQGQGVAFKVGDLIFCRPAQGDPIGALVAGLTGGPYCHVQIVAAPRLVIEARPLGGVVKTPLLVDVGVDAGPDPADVARVGARLSVMGRARGVSWLLGQVGDGYGYSNIYADALQLLLPRWLGSRTPFLVAPSRYDCSNLATRFLIHAGYFALPDAVIDDPTRVSPNGLARALGLLK